MEITRAEIDAVFDAHGRFVLTPDPIKLDGQKNIPCDLQEGESLLAFLRRHVPGIDSGAWAVRIGGIEIPCRMWAKTFPKHGMLIACRATVGRQAVQLVAIAALAWFSGGLAAGLYGAMGGTYVAASAGMMLSALQMGIVVAGSILINKVLGPKVPKAGAALAARQVYSLSGQRNSPRPYEAVGTLFGEMRVTPDLASQPYGWYESDEQFMSTILLGGINVHSAADLSIGDTAIASYHDVDVYHNGFAGMANQSVPLFSNMDALPGGELPDTQEWVTRTSAVDAVSLFLDFEYLLYAQGNKGLKRAFCTVQAQYREVGASAWSNFFEPKKFNNNKAEARRISYRLNVPQGQYELRVRRVATTTPDKSTRTVTLVSLRTAQPDKTDYSQFGRIGIKIKATGQISGSLDTVRATYRAKPMPIWNGAAWATATTRDNGLSNPGAIILLTLRGIWHKGKLQFGFGLSDDQIDMEGIKAFMLYCQAKGYTYDRWVTESVNLQEFCQEVALAGMGEFSWTDGSRPTVVFVSAGQPVSAVVNMANMLKASFSVDYALSNAADGIEYQYVDRAKKFETVTLRVAAPGVTSPLNPARIKGEGVTTEAHAAVMARYHLAQSLYQYKTIGFGADIEHLDYRRLSLLSVSHDLTQWGFGGRLEGIIVGNGYVQVQLGEAVPALSTPKLGLRLPGDRDYRMWPVQEFVGESDTLILLGDWPEGVSVPGSTEADPAHDTLWCYDFKATPGYRVRVTGIAPNGDLKGAQVTCVPEGPEFWDYVLNGSYEPAPNPSALPQLARPSVQNLRVQEQTNVQGNTQWWELYAAWEVEGEADHCQVWAGLDGSELTLVDARAMGNRSSWRIDEPGEYLVQVRPFDASGRAGDAASVLYITAGVDVPPVNASNFVVQELPGGLRRFAWSFAGDLPAAFAGVQIRYAEGDASVSAAAWDELTPLGDADDVYTAQFETTKPAAGVYTFALRTVNTSGQLSSGVLRFVANLGSSFEQVQQPDLTPPPAVTGLVVVAGLAAVQVQWDAPIYSQGRGHARTEVWAAAQSDLQQATKMAEGYAGPVSFNAEPATTYYVWARNVTADGVPGEWAGPVSGETGQNPEKLLEVLEGEIKESHLYIDLTKRIDIIDKDGGVLGRTLVDAAAQQDALNQSVRTDMNDMAQGLLEAALAADAALERITDAGVYVDPATGTVKIYGLEVTKDQVTNLQVLLDTLSGQLQLKATTAYVDGKIAEATLSPADLLLYEGLDARVVAVTQTLDGINGVLASKASQLELAGALARLSTAESTLDALSGQIALRVTRAEYEAGQNAVNSRLGSAELLLSTLDAPSITATVLSAARGSKDAEKSAQALLQDILAGERRNDEVQEALAFARQDLTAAYQAEVAAEAAQRLQLAVQMNNQSAALQTEQSVRAEQTGYLGTLYSVRMSLDSGGNTVVGGFAMSGTNHAGAGPEFDFGVLANRFFVASPAGSGLNSSFQLTIQTTPTTVNGVTIPAGLYVDSAYITNVNALWGRFGTLVADSIQTTAISASQLTAGNGVIGGSLKSANYVSGSSGWTLRPDGVAEFSGVTVRGTVYATSGTIGSVVIAQDHIRSSNFNSSAGLGWRLHSNGSLSLPRGSIGSAEIADLSVKSAHIENLAVDTAQIAGNAVTFSVGAYATGTLNLGDNNTPADAEIMSASTTCSGAPVNVHVAFHCRPYGDIDGYKNRSHEWSAQLIRVKDGVETVVFTGWLGYARVLNTNTYGWGLGSVAFNRRDNPGAGAVTYKLRVYNTSGQNGLSVYHRSMILSELKK